MAVAACHTAIVGGKRSVRLRVIGGYVEIDDHVPATRAECKDGPRPCPHVRCEWHLWLQRGEDGPGRRVAGKPPASTLRPVWMDWPLPPSCGADLADEAERKGEMMTVAEIGRAMDLRSTQIHETLATGRQKLKAENVNMRRLMYDEDE